MPDADQQATTPSQSQRTPRVLLVDRGDALTSSLSEAMRERFDIIDTLDVELSRPERLLVAGTTLRPTRQAWADRFYKSNLGVDLRSRRARALLAGPAAQADVVFQTHALFETAHPRTMMYIDCTHRQSMEQWPAWNPLRGRALQRWLARERRQYHQAAHLFAFSEETARSIIEQYGVAATRVTVVGAGVNFAQTAQVGMRRHGPPTVLFVGNDFTRKGGPELLEAFALVRRHLPDARLRIVGTCRSVPAQEGVEQLGRIHDRDQLSRIYADAHVFCLPSHFDPFPGVLLEAMAHGLPSVVSAVCGIPEIVVDGVTAITVPHGRAGVPQLAAALEHLLTHPERASSMGDLARGRVRDRFLWSHVLDRMAPAFEEPAAAACLEPSRPQSPPTGHRPDADRHPPGKGITMTQTTDHHLGRDTLVSHRPWGAFEQFSLNEPSTVKIITVEPGSRLSLQRHQHRNEFWQVLDGPMDIEVDDRRWTAQEGEHIWVPAESTHRMANTGDGRARILEVAFGRFDEDDIERLDDDYGR